MQFPEKHPEALSEALSEELSPEEFLKDNAQEFINKLLKDSGRIKKKNSSRTDFLKKLVNIYGGSSGKNSTRYIGKKS